MIVKMDLLALCSTPTAAFVPLAIGSKAGKSILLSISKKILNPQKKKIRPLCWTGEIVLARDVFLSWAEKIFIFVYKCLQALMDMIFEKTCEYESVVPKNILEFILFNYVGR